MRLPRLTGKKLCRIVESFGFTHIHTAGSHAVYKHKDGRRTTIPVHGKEIIGPGLLNKIIKDDLGVSRERFMEAARR